DGFEKDVLVAPLVEHLRNVSGDRFEVREPEPLGVGARRRGAGGGALAREDAPGASRERDAQVAGAGVEVGDRLSGERTDEVEDRSDEGLVRVVADLREVAGPKAHLVAVDERNADEIVPESAPPAAAAERRARDPRLASQERLRRRGVRGCEGALG